MLVLGWYLSRIGILLGLFWEDPRDKSGAPVQVRTRVGHHMRNNVGKVYALPREDRFAYRFTAPQTKGVLSTP